MRPTERGAGRPARQWRVLAGSALLLPVVGWWLRRGGVRHARTRLQALAGSRAAPAPADGEVLATARALAAAVNAAARRGPYRANCLRRSLVLEWWLQRRGIDCRLRIGVDTADGGLAAHAWVEHRGVVLNDRPEVAEHYAVLEGGR
ncbi:MAG: lasso peptide biosynthesis B2 protein [Xanthomonadales bacterium]|nr:lasso peptide biosynthesis B2 protein [Xanthomonadales bacterium]NIN60464.1 lasso peptide biosynthesis B2 protein [Xanthomonadales bacterium]NIN75817.1 lasso peptide biosynthesis B2 protein [Xanthomonadales bacterium]NIO12995.1 lasso peptide biosynthesis B2 protein [Xanthomonadales bacterium]NIP12857.1 lasso peptide biosynthesis B2 protein [Xanthomonadales bacterium]